MQAIYILFFAFYLVAYLTGNSLVAQSGVEDFIGPEKKRYRIRYFTTNSPSDSRLYYTVYLPIILGLLVLIGGILGLTYYVGRKREQKMKKEAIVV